MGAAHHGEFSPEEQRKQRELMERFIGQVEDRAKRNYSQGRIGANDDGDLAMAITADRAKNIVIIDFGKPVTWMGLPPEQVNGLVNLLMQKLRELGAPATISV
jgi:hypothetical protein